MYKFDIRDDPATGLQTRYMLPDDIILNTRRAFSTSTTSPTGYSELGVPEGRYIAPANSDDCIQLKAGDCAPRTLLVRAPFFTRFDIGVTKRFPISGSTNFELRVDVLNVFDNINFDTVSAREAARRSSSPPPPIGREQQVRSRRPARSARVPPELVNTDVSQNDRGSTW